MKKIIIIVMFALTIPRFVPAQGTTFLSSLSQTSTGGHILGNDSWLAAEFESGNNAGGYLLNSIQLGMMDASGNPTDFLVMIYANDGNHSGENPGSSLGTLNGSSNPITAVIYAYSLT